MTLALVLINNVFFMNNVNQTSGLLSVVFLIREMKTEKRKEKLFTNRVISHEGFANIITTVLSLSNFYVTMDLYCLCEVFVVRRTTTT